MRSELKSRDKSSYKAIQESYETKIKPAANETNENKQTHPDMWCISRHNHSKPIHNLCRSDTGSQREPGNYVDRDRQAVGKKCGCSLRTKREECELQRRKAGLARSKPSYGVFH